MELYEDADGDGKCSVLIALMQKHRRQQKKLGVRDLCIGYAVYKVSCSHDPITAHMIPQLLLILCNRPLRVKTKWINNL